MPILLTLMNSKLPDEQQISDKQKYIFQKRKSYEISSTDIYIGKDLEFITHVTWLKLYLVKIKSSGITSQQAGKKNICHSVPKSFDFSQNCFVPFHQVTFDHSISCVLLTDKPNESFKNSKKFEKKCLICQKKNL